MIDFGGIKINGKTERREGGRREERSVYGGRSLRTEKLLLVEYLVPKFLPVGKRILKPSRRFTGFSSHKEEVIPV